MTNPQMELINLANNPSIYKLGIKKATRAFERQLAFQSLERNNQNKSLAAYELQTSRENLNYVLRPEDGRPKTKKEKPIENIQNSLPIDQFPNKKKPTKVQKVDKMIEISELMERIKRGIL